jgi:DNA-binding CsgD family transcriptional regulator
MKAAPIHLKNFIRTHSWTLRIGLLTAIAIIGFQVISLCVIYRYLKLDYYLSLVAVCFLVTGLMLNKRQAKAEPVSLPASPPDHAEQLQKSREDLLALLTSKEVLVLRLLAEGKTNKEIAAAQFIELSTVKTHVNNIYSKLSVSNRKEARSRYAEMAQKFPVS